MVDDHSLTGGVDVRGESGGEVVSIVVVAIVAVVVVVVAIVVVVVVVVAVFVRGEETDD